MLLSSLKRIRKPNTHLNSRIQTTEMSLKIGLVGLIILLGSSPAREVPSIIEKFYKRPAGRSRALGHGLREAGGDRSSGYGYHGDHVKDFNATYL
ncbi:hypothetical protein GGS23DRAFT_601119 [Durotheca rogersii]|uniref:uncharacterized protein n=1 Tax=Durotheca rogersii TaxID=419775 RepID=UPI00221EAC94|nr:uncharacterized protein GGS23DRAFT_601119 [Durotheca rogersii]KAI5856709.1 hypothetical protein GGS23DRAFT_601119 [Durotheca rogersii]